MVPPLPDLSFDRHGLQELKAGKFSLHLVQRHKQIRRLGAAGTVGRLFPVERLKNKDPARAQPLHG